MLKLIFLLIVCYVAFKLLRTVFFVLTALSGPKKGPDRQEGPAEMLPTPLISCPTCGTFFQERQGVRSGSRAFCSEACARKT